MGWLAGAALVPLLAGNRSASAQIAGGRFNPPAGPMRLTRQLSRQLADGAQIVIERTWEVQFRNQAAGYSLDGRQVAVEVSAPHSLEMLARIERDRTESGLFPIELDRNGLISADAETGSLAPIDQAVSQARKRIEASGLSTKAAADARQFLAYLQKSAADLSSQMPGDLFHPVRPNWQENRTIRLPHGQTGSVSVSFTAITNPEAGLMERAQRIIVTEIGEASRTSRENWKLLPA